MEKNDVLNKIPIRVGHFPIDYLGVPLFKRALNIHHLCPVADRILSQFDS